MTRDRRTISGLLYVLNAENAVLEARFKTCSRWADGACRSAAMGTKRCMDCG